MVGKPNFPPDADVRDDLVGLAMPTEGLTALDQEREGSMADEGGTSGAVMESQDGDCGCDPTAHRPYSHPDVCCRDRRMLAGLFATGAGLALMGLGLSLRSR